VDSLLPAVLFPVIYILIIGDHLLRERRWRQEAARSHAQFEARWGPFECAFQNDPCTVEGAVEGLECDYCVTNPRRRKSSTKGEAK
jgi:hypothetical protein